MRIALTTPPPTSLAAGAFPRPPAWLHALQPELTLNPLPVLGSPHPCVRTCVRHRNPTPGGWTPGALSRAQGIAWRGCRLGVTHGPTRPPVCPLRKPPAAGFLQCCRLGRRRVRKLTFWIWALLNVRLGSRRFGGGLGECGFGHGRHTIHSLPSHRVPLKAPAAAVPRVFLHQPPLSHTRGLPRLRGRSLEAVPVFSDGRRSLCSANMVRPYWQLTGHYHCLSPCLAHPQQRKQ